MGAATKAVISGSGILLVAAALGGVHGWQALWVIPVLFLAGLTFACLGLVMSALAPGYDYFNYYMTLVLTPMFILSGVFYPVSALPAAVQSIVQVLPLAHAVDLIRPLVADRPLADVGLHFGVLALYGIGVSGRGPAGAGPISGMSRPLHGADQGVLS